ncbi:MAG: beta-ketoacyl-ACP synthase II [Thermoleophilia bacterium]|nr:beta-ketoacyl-ACP synthase II [Thermoleophilia bacterium]MDH3724904.1 beta-ketoacyl-ACP synthase II [Thermoleophilia bacterium]
MPHDSIPEVVVTGIGMISSLGVGRHESWLSAREGRSGAAPVTAFDTSDYGSKIACEAKGFDPLDFLDRKNVRRSDRACHLAVGAARLALDDAELTINGNSREVGAVIASGGGGHGIYEHHLDTLAERGPDRVSPLAVASSIINMPAGMVSMELGLQGPLSCPVTACASSTHALGEGAHMIRRGAASAILAGGSEASIAPFIMAALDATRALSRRNDEPGAASRPFDADRDGFVLGEGAAVLVLESREHAERRGAPIICTLAGYGASGDAHHLTEPAPDGSSQAAALRICLERAGRGIDEVGYVNAHGTSTPTGDPVEVGMLRSVFGDRAPDLPVSSTKSMHGHCMGAGGALEAGLVAMTIGSGVIPPTINLESTDPECTGVDHVTAARDASVDLALSNSFGFGGHNAVIALATAA